MNNILYAIVKINNKQYKISVGDKIKIDNNILYNINNIININKILLIKKKKYLIIGNPTIKNYEITAIVVSKDKYKKIKIFKMKRRKHSQKLQGYRQKYIKLKILSILIKNNI